MGRMLNITQSTELAFARNPSINWISDIDALGPDLGPEEGTSGLNVGLGIVDAVAAYVQINPAVYNTGKSSFHTIKANNFAVANVYTIILGGTSYVSTGTQLTIEATVNELVTLINAGAFGTAGGSARAIAMSGGTADTIFCFHAGSTFTVNATVTGTGIVDLKTDFRSYTDATACSARIWVKKRNPGLPVAPPWSLASNGDLGVIPAQGYDERLNLAGFEAVYVELYSVTKDGTDGADMIARPWVTISPAIPEE